MISERGFWCLTSKIRYVSFSENETKCGCDNMRKMYAHHINNETSHTNKNKVLPYVQLSEKNIFTNKRL